MIRTTQQNNVRIMGIPEKEGKQPPEGIFEQIIAENFPNLGKDIGIEIEERELPLNSTKTNHH